MITASGIGRFARKLVSDVHAQNAVVLPAYAALEVTRTHLSSQQSLDTRVAAYASGFMGAGLAYAWGNDMVRKGIARLGGTSRRAQGLMDAVYGSAFFYVYSLNMYHYITGLPWDEANSGALAGAVTGIVLGGPVGRVTNLFRDAFTIDNPDGKPTFLRGASLTKRLSTVALTAALALGTTAAIYTAKDHYDAHRPVQPATTFERVVGR